MEQESELALVKVRASYAQLAAFFGEKAPTWLAAWFEAVSISNARYDALSYDVQPSRVEHRKKIALERTQLQLELDAASAAANLKLVAQLHAKLARIEQLERALIGKNGQAKRGPNKSEITPKVLIAARLVEVFRRVNGRDPSPRNRKLTAALVSLLETVGLMREPVGDPLNGARKAFSIALRSELRLGRHQSR